MAMDGSDGPHKVAVGAMVRFAYRSVFGRLELVLELGWIMLLALLATLILPNVLLPDRVAAEGWHLDALDGGEAVIALLSLSAFAVRWHQSILLGDPRRLSPRVFFRAWLRFLAYGCAIYLVIGAIAGIALLGLTRLGASDATQALVGLAAIMLGILVALGTLRCGMIFPAAARGRPIGLVTAWRLLRGNSWRFALASMVTALPVTAMTAVLTAIVIAVALPEGAELVTTPPLGFAILTGLIEAVSDILLVALGATLLSGFYRELVARRDDGSVEQPTQR